MSDLSNPAEKPSLNVEAMLRALGVLQPGGGVNYEALARVAVIGVDLSQAFGEVTLPQGYIGSGLVGVVNGGVNTWSGVEIQAGPRG